MSAAELGTELPPPGTAANPVPAAPGLRIALQSLLDHLACHLSLLKLESSSELSRLGKVLGFWAGLILTLQSALMLISITAIAWLWDTPYRVMSIVLCLGALLLLAILIWLRLQALTRMAAQRFSTSSLQWQRDMELIKTLL